MKFITVLYEDALKFNSIIWDAYVAKIKSLPMVAEYFLILDKVLNKFEIVLEKKLAEELDIIKDIKFFEFNFSNSMIVIKKILDLLPKDVVIEFNENYIQLPTLASLKAIEYMFPFSDGTFSYFDVFNVNKENMIDIYIDQIVIKSTNDKNVHQNDKEFINNLLKN